MHYNFSIWISKEIAIVDDIILEEKKNDYSLNILEGIETDLKLRVWLLNHMLFSSITLYPEFSLKIWCLIQITKECH